MNDSTMVTFRGVSKQYRRGRERTNVRAIIPGRFGEQRRGEFHWALHDVSFALEKGRSLGFVGPNGAGKSTALKLVAGVTAPTSGQVFVGGRSASLIELGAGFHPDMTGRENVYFSASVLGMGPSEIKRRFDQITDFAGIDSFLDTPVKRYSSGMMARLGFAIASHLDVEIVVLDEVLAVGDAAFQRKCHDRIATLRKDGAALLYVTHALWTLPLLCDEAILLVAGKVAAQGTPAEVIRAYERFNPQAEAEPAGTVMFRSVTSSASVVDPGGSVRVQIEMDLQQPYPFGKIMVGVRGADDTNIGVVASTAPDVSFDQVGPMRIECELTSLPLYPGPYSIVVGFCADLRLPVVDDIRKLGIDVRGEENPPLGFTSFPVQWSQKFEAPESAADRPEAVREEG
jgi:ABC-type polysaccharide/polyol phosphate transport system ATPase subunit